MSHVQHESYLSSTSILISRYNCRKSVDKESLLRIFSPQINFIVAKPHSFDFVNLFAFEIIFPENFQIETLSREMCSSFLKTEKFPDPFTVKLAIALRSEGNIFLSFRLLLSESKFSPSRIIL